jgi:hypothetical protein
MNLRKNFLPVPSGTPPSERCSRQGPGEFYRPDSLTRYRVMAVVQTAKDQFGSGESP